MKIRNGTESMEKYNPIEIEKLLNKVLELKEEDK